MNFARPPRAVSFKLVAAIVVGSFAIALACTPSRPPPPDEPAIVYVDASDAAALLDVGASPSDCALMCASWAKGHCRAATADCLVVCARETRVDGFYSPRLLPCVIKADGDHAALHDCNERACP